LRQRDKDKGRVGGGDEVVRGKDLLGFIPTEVNPAIIQYLYEQYSGGPGKVIGNTLSIGGDLLDLSKGLYNGESWKDIQTDFNMRKVEALKAFVQQGDDRTAYYRTQAKYRKYKADAAELYDAVKGYEESAATDPMALPKLEKISASEDFVRMQIVREADKTLNQINKAVNKAEGKEKRKLKQLYNEQMKAVVDMLDEVGKE
jgi:hypothetical protein